MFFFFFFFLKSLYIAGLRSCYLQRKAKKLKMRINEFFHLTFKKFQKFHFRKVSKSECKKE